MYVLFILCVMPRLLSSNNRAFERRLELRLEFPWHVGWYTLYTILYIYVLLSCRYFYRPVRFGKSGDSRENACSNYRSNRWRGNVSRSDFEFRFYLNINHHRRKRERKREISFVTLLSHFPRLP